MPYLHNVELAHDALCQDVAHHTAAGMDVCPVAPKPADDTRTITPTWPEIVTPEEGGGDRGQRQTIWLASYAGTCIGSYV